MNRLICSIVVLTVTSLAVSSAKPLLSTPGASSLAKAGR